MNVFGNLAQGPLEANPFIFYTSYCAQRNRLINPLHFITVGGYVKKSFLFLTLALASVSGFAEESITPVELCSKVAKLSGDNGRRCVQIIARNEFDSASLRLANTALMYGTITPVRVLEVTANGRLDAKLEAFCKSVIRLSSSNGVQCAQYAMNKTVSEELLAIAYVGLKAGSTSALSILKEGGESKFSQPLAKICEQVTSLSSSAGLECVKVIANKTSHNNLEKVCEASLRLGSTSVVNCLKEIVVDSSSSSEINKPVTTVVDVRELEDLKRSLTKTRALLNRSLIDQAQKELDDAVETVNQLLLPGPILY